MTKTICITGATDGIGKLTAQTLATQGHTLLLHGRNPAKLEALGQTLGAEVHTYVADLSSLRETDAMARKISAEHPQIDALINNAGVFKIPQPRDAQGFDLRFVVNTIAPYRLTKGLLAQLSPQGRIVNLSSAAQARVDPQALLGKVALEDMEAYAQSKLAITIWTAQLAKELAPKQVAVAVNPGSLLASKMVKEGFGVPGKSLSIGADILIKAALDPAFADASGRYFDNDAGAFAPVTPGMGDPQQVHEVMRALDEAVEQLLG